MLQGMLLAILPILVELFTSEGCSSCPAADAALARLHQAQPVPGVELVVLAEHVDYWDDLGWKDRFSDHVFTERQSRYGSRIYTPQAVVDGRVDVLGSDGEGIARAAKAAALTPHGAVTITPGKDGSVRIAVSSLPKHGAAQVFAAVVEDGLVSKVERGENAGRTLPHMAVVRSLKAIGSIAASEAQRTFDATIPADTAWAHTRLVVFVQEREDARVIAVASR
jgi:hypothetical protein